MNKSEAVKQGTIDGAEDAELVYHEQGADDAERTLPPGTWTEIAGGVNVASIMDVPSEHKTAYYKAYERAARKRVRELLMTDAMVDLQLVARNHGRHRTLSRGTYRGAAKGQRNGL